MLAFNSLKIANKRVKITRTISALTAVVLLILTLALPVLAFVPTQLPGYEGITGSELGQQILGAWGESSYSGISGFFLNLIGFQSFGIAIADNFWFSIFGVYLIVVGAVVAGWTFDMMEESGEHGWKMAIVVAVGFGITALGFLTHFPNGFWYGYLIPAAFFFWNYRSSSSHLYAVVFIWYVVTLLPWFSPASMDAFGYLNWCNWTDAAGWTTGRGPGIRTGWWKDYPDFLGDIGGWAVSAMRLSLGLNSGSAPEVTLGEIWSDMTTLPHVSTSGYRWWEWFFPPWRPWFDIREFVWFWVAVIATGITIILVIAASLHFRSRAKRGESDMKVAVGAAVGGSAWAVVCSAHTITLVLNGFWLLLLVGGLVALCVIGAAKDSQHRIHPLIVFAIGLVVYYIICTVVMVDLVWLRTMRFGHPAYWAW